MLDKGDKHKEEEEEEQANESGGILYGGCGVLHQDDLIYERRARSRLAYRLVSFR